MNLGALRAEVLNHGFDATQFGSARINQYLNDAYLLVCRRVDFYANESTQTFTSVAGTATYPLPANWARVRSLLDTDRGQELQQVLLRDVDRAVVQQGTPFYYALDSTNLRLYPTPDSSSHDYQLRYWLLPTALVNDGDTPDIPSDWHNLLWYYATAEAYWAEDDSGNGAQWEARFEKKLAEFEADVRFPSTDYPTRVKSMWGDDAGLGSIGWTRWPQGSL